MVSPNEAYVYMSAINKTVRLWCDSGKVHLFIEEFLRPISDQDIGLPFGFKMLDLEHDTVLIPAA
jgi:hypothetical protein